MKYYICMFVGLMLACINNAGAGQKSSGQDPRVISVKTVQPEERKVYPIAIIGSGAAGTMAVKRSILNNTETLLFTGAKKELKRSRGTWVRTVDNVPGLEKYGRAILEIRNETLKELVQSPLGSKLFVIDDSVGGIEKKGDFFKLTDGSGRTYYARFVVLATGMMDEQPQIQGSIKPVLKYANGQTIAYCLLCDGHRALGKKTVVIGFSESAGSNAVLLSDKYQLKNMTILTNGKKAEFSPELRKRIQSKNIKIVEAPIQEVVGNLESRQLAGFKLETGDLVDAEIAFVSLGVRPNNQLALQLGAKVDKSGLVITDSNGESSIPNLFVAGDLRSGSLKQIYTAWQHSVDSLQVINQRIREKN